MNFFGGEPFINPDCLDTLESALGAGMSLILATNCYFLADDRVRDRFLEISRGYRDKISITVGDDTVGRVDKIQGIAGIRFFRRLR